MQEKYYLLSVIQLVTFAFAMSPLIHLYSSIRQLLRSGSTLQYQIKNEFAVIHSSLSNVRCNEKL